MRIALLVPLAAAMPVAAWGITAEEALSEAEEMISPRPGQYLTVLELLHFDAPGMGKGTVPQMSNVFAKGLAEGNTFCLSPEDVADHPGREMLASLAEGNCTFDEFDITGETVRADMQCRYGGDRASRVTLNGRMTAVSSEVVMTTEQKIANIGLVRIKMHVSSQRVGECPLAAASDGEGGADAKASAKLRVHLRTSDVD